MSDAACPAPAPPDESDLTRVALQPAAPLTGYLDAMQLARDEAERRLDMPMLLSWYDRDRDFEAPQHVSECHQHGATPGYVDYALSHGASLRIDIEGGRFVFYYRDAAI